MLQGEKTSYGINGNYSGAVEVGTDDGSSLYLKDSANGKKTLAQILANVAAHNIGDHGNMSSDFATQYYNAARLGSFLGNAANGNAVAVSGDIGGSASLGAHVMNPAVHQRVPKFVLRVAKGGQQYSTISAALAAIPTSGADAPSPDRWWRVEVSPGVYAEPVLIEKQWVEVVGAGVESTRIRWDNSAAAGTWPVRVAADNVLLSGLSIESSNPTFAENIALLLGVKTGGNSFDSVTVRNCYLGTAGAFAVWVAGGVTATIDHCDVRAEYGMGARVDGYSSFKYCGFLDSIGGASDGIDLRGGASLFCCVSDIRLLVVINASVSVFGCLGRGSDVLVVDGVGNTATNINWDGNGFSNLFGTSGGLRIFRIADSGVYTKQGVVVDWAIPIEEPVQKHFSAGHSGTSLYESAGAFGGDGPDFHFYRKVVLDTAALTGDVFAIGDDSNTGGSGNDANALALYLGNNNDGGKFLRWGRGDMSTFAELGYISGDGVMHAAGFVGSPPRVLTGSGNVIGATDSVVVLDETGGGVTCTLPRAADFPGKKIVVTLVDPTSYESVIEPSSGDVIMYAGLDQSDYIPDNHGTTRTFISLGALNRWAIDGA